MSWELSVPDNDDLSAKSALAMTAIVKVSLLYVLWIGAPFDFKDSIAEAASRRLFSTSPPEIIDNHVSAGYDRFG